MPYLKNRKNSPAVPSLFCFVFKNQYYHILLIHTLTCVKYFPLVLFVLFCVGFFVCSVLSCFPRLHALLTDISTASLSAAELHC